MALTWKSVAWTAVKVKARINRGQSWTDFIRYFAYVLVIVRLLTDAAKDYFGMDVSELKWIYILSPVAYLLTIYLIGYADELKGIWKIENIYNSRDLNPFMDEVDKKISRTELAITRVEKGLETIKFMLSLKK